MIDDAAHHAGTEPGVGDVTEDAGTELGARHVTGYAGTDPGAGYVTGGAGTEPAEGLECGRGQLGEEQGQPVDTSCPIMARGEPFPQSRILAFIETSIS